MADRSDTLKLIISGDGKLVRAEIGRTQDAITRFARTSENAFTRVGAKIQSTIGKVIKNPITLIGGTAGVLAAGREVLQFDDKIATLRNQFNMTAEQALVLRNRIIKTADDAKQSWDDVVNSAMELADKTGNLDLVTNGLFGIGVAAKATSSDMLDIARVSEALTMNMDVLPGQLMDAFNILAAQGDQGSFVFKEMATQAERLGASAAIMKLSGLKDLKEYGAFLQMIRPSFSSADEASTAVKNIATRIQTESKKIKKSLHFDVYDSNKQLKPFAQLIEGIVKSANGNVTKLNDIFGESSIAFTGFNKELASGNGFQKFEGFMNNVGSDVLWNKFQVKADAGQSKITELHNAFSKLSDKAMVAGIAELTKYIDYLTQNPEKITQFAEELAKIVHSIATVLGSAFKIGHWIFDDRSQSNLFGKNRKQFDSLPESEKSSLKKQFKGKSYLDVNNIFENYVKNSAVPSSASPVSVQNIIKMDVTVTDTGKVITKTSDPSLRVDINSNRGSFRGAQ